MCASGSPVSRGRRPSLPPPAFRYFFGRFHISELPQQSDVIRNLQSAGENPRPELYGKGSQAGAEQGNQSRTGERGESNVDRAERLEQQDRLALDAIHLLE